MIQRRAIRILIVDDNMLVRTATKMLLGTYKDFEVIGEAGDGATGVKMALNLEPDVVLMDINMQPVSGIEATRILTGTKPTFIIIGFSALPHPHEELSMLEAGAVGVIHKSAGRKEICGMVLQLYQEHVS